MSDNKERGIGEIGNYYGGLSIRVCSGVYEFGIEDYVDTYWQEIPKYLYDALSRFQDEQENKNS